MRRFCSVFVFRRTRWIRQQQRPQSCFFSGLEKSSTTDNTSCEVFDNNAAWLQKTFGLSDEWGKRAGKMLNLNSLKPSVLMERSEWLQKRLQLEHDEMGTILRRFPTILTFRPHENLDPTIDYLQEELALEGKAFSRVIKSHPMILGLGIHPGQGIPSNLNWIRKRLHVKDAKQMGKVITREGSLLCMNVDTNLEPSFRKLQSRLEIEEAQMAKLFVNFPILLVLSYEKNFVPKLDWLQELLELNKSQVGKMIVRYPSLLASDLGERWQTNAVWLQNRLGLDDATVKRLIFQAPFLLGLSVDKNIAPTLLWLCHNLSLEQDKTTFAKVICRCPRLLGLNVTNNSEPTLLFYKRHLGEKNAVEWVVGDPTVMTYSLERRLKPRLEQSQLEGIKMDVSCMHAMSSLTNSAWLKWLAARRKNETHN